jgi:hypothetical protein
LNRLEEEIEGGETDLASLNLDNEGTMVLRRLSLKANRNSLQDIDLLLQQDQSETIKRRLSWER